MQVTSNFNQPVRTQLPTAQNQQNPAPQGPEQPEGPENKDSFWSSALHAGATIANRAGESGLYYLGGGGTMGGCIAFGAAYQGISGAIDGGVIGYQARHTKGAAANGAILGGLIGAGSGTLQGWSTYVLATACGGGLGGALIAGAALGTGQVVADALFGKK